MSVELVVPEFTDVFGPICKCIAALSMFIAIFPCTDVHRAVGKGMGALSVFFAIFPGTNVFVLRRPRIGSQAVVPGAFVVTTWTLGRPPPLT